MKRLTCQKKIEHINFAKIINENNFLGNDLFVPDDKASHLNDETQSRVIEYIFDYIFENNLINDIKL